jgi:hypothetical protein
MVQIDSAINHGNSGGPVLQNGKVVGVAFQSFSTAENTGYIIPVLVIQRFLTDVEDGKYDGHPKMGISLFKDVILNKGTSQYFHFDKEKPYGLVVTAVALWSPLYKVIKKEDILVSIDGNKIGSDGKIKMFGERVAFPIIYDLKQYGEKIDLLVIRQGVKIHLSLSVEKSKKHYSKSFLYDQPPKYLVYGGLVFSSLTRNYLKTWGKNWYKKIPSLLKYIHFKSSFSSRFSGIKDFIVLIDLLPHKINGGVKKQKNSVVWKVNGTVVEDMKHFVGLLEKKTEKFMLIEFYNNVEPIVLNREEVGKYQSEILKSYDIKIDRWLGEG